MKELVQGFYVEADGKTFGPFKGKYEEKMAKLFHYKGIKIRYEMVEKERLLPRPKQRRAKKENLKLDFGKDWIPIQKG